MPVLKKPDLHPMIQQTLSASIVLLFVHLLTATLVFATGITIKHSETYRQGDIYLLNADIEFDFSEESLNALEHGIALQIYTILRLKKERDWLWDTIISETVLRFRMEHHPLSDHYVVTDLLADVQHTFQTRQAATSFLTKLNNIPFFEASLLKDNMSYTGHIRTQLDIESLPAPLRPIAYLSSHWQLSSSWHSWKITQ